jgi:hypothetical protein
MPLLHLIVLVLLMNAPAAAQSTNDPFPTPIPTTEGAITVKFRPFAVVPDMEGIAARTMTLVNEAATRRLFVNDMRGPIYGVSYDGRRVLPYVDVNAPQWGVVVQSSGRERGVQSFAFHPQFSERGTRGFGKFYTLTDTANTKPTPDFRPLGGTRTHDTVLLEWTAKTPTADAYDGGPPRELMRVEQPFANHNGGLLAFNPTAVSGAPDYGLLYMSFADGGSGGDPFSMAQNLGSLFGKLLRIDPSGTNSGNGKYGIPAANPFAADNDPKTLGEIYAYGVRNPQRFTWDAKNGNMFLADIGQNIVEEVDLVTAGANLGWNAWEGSYKFLSREGVDRSNPRSDPAVIYPIVEYGQLDPLLQPQSAVTMGVVYRQTAIKQLTDRLVFGDIPSGELFYVSADSLPKGGQDPLRRILLTDGGGAKTLLEFIRAENAKQGKPPATRADLRFGVGPEGQIFLLNKADGVIRVLVPDGP